MKEADPGSRERRERTPDLQTQLETLLHQVWVSEADWRFEERLRLALAARRERRR